MNATTHFHVTAELVSDGAGGQAVRLSQQDGIEEPHVILLHPWQLRAIAQQLGLPPEVEAQTAERTVEKLGRWLRLLHGRVTELAYHLHHLSDTAHADLTFEQQHATATADIADALLTELADSERSAVTPAAAAGCSTCTPSTGPEQLPAQAGRQVSLDL